MGHYRSEMGFDDAAEAKRENEAMTKRAKKIRAVIEEKGVEYVLAEIIDNPTLASIRYR